MLGSCPALTDTAKNIILKEQGRKKNDNSQLEAQGKQLSDRSVI